MLTKGCPATRLATLHFLARQAFFAEKAAPQVSTHTYEHPFPSHCSFPDTAEPIRALKAMQRHLLVSFTSCGMHLLAQ